MVGTEKFNTDMKVVEKLEHGNVYGFRLQCGNETSCHVCYNKDFWDEVNAGDDIVMRWDRRPDWSVRPLLYTKPSVVSSSGTSGCCVVIKKVKHAVGYELILLCVPTWELVTMDCCKALYDSVEEGDCVVDNSERLADGNIKQRIKEV